MSWVPSPSEVGAIIQAGGTLVGWVIDLIRKAVTGDREALEKLKRVDDVLSDESPTGKAFKRVDEIAAGKPPRPS